MEGWAIVNGVESPLADACIPVTDLGFTHGYSVFETLVLGPGRDLSDHLERLARSADAAMIGHPGDDVLRAEVARVAERVGPGAIIRITLTGDGRRVLFGTPRDPSRRFSEIRCATEPCPRPTRHIDGTVKHRSRMDWIVAVRRHGVDEVIFVDDEGRITEGTTSAVLASLGGALLTAAWDGRILRSTTVARLLRLADDIGIEVVREGPVAEGPFDALYVASTTRWISPVVELDGRPLPSWDPVGLRLAGALRERGFVLG